MIPAGILVTLKDRLDLVVSWGLGRATVGNDGSLRAVDSGVGADKEQICLDGPRGDGAAVLRCCH
jgi:hypothetical protein